MLGVTNLRNLGVVAAAEFAIASYQPIIPLAAESSTGLESKYSSDDDDNYRNKNDITDKEERELANILQGRHICQQLFFILCNLGNQGIYYPTPIETPLMLSPMPITMLSIQLSNTISR